MKTGWFAAALLATSAFAAPMVAAQDNETKLLRDPSLSDNKLAFAYAGDIWVANADGSNPVRLTSHAATERDPIFSPDGTKIAYTANYDGKSTTPMFVICKKLSQRNPTMPCCCICTMAIHLCVNF